MMRIVLTLLLIFIFANLQPQSKKIEESKEELKFESKLNFDSIKRVTEQNVKEIKKHDSVIKKNDGYIYNLDKKIKTDIKKIDRELNNLDVDSTIIYFYFDENIN